jgi:hypothetical protein
MTSRIFRRRGQNDPQRMDERRMLTFVRLYISPDGRLSKKAREESRSRRPVFVLVNWRIVFSTIQ